MGDKLELFLLGGVRFKLNGQPVEMPTSRKATALFIYLAHNRRTFSRDTLAGMFYGDLPQKKARTNLRVLLKRLGSLKDFLHVTRQSLAFGTGENTWLDTAVFTEQLLAITGQTTMNDPLHPETAAQLAQTLNLYRGDFLAGFYLRDALDFEEWVLFERERIQRLAIQGLDRLVTYYLENCQYQPGIEQAARLLQLDLLREQSHRQMMLLLAQSGQRNAALAQYERCAQILAEELDAEPDAETQTLFERIQALELMAQEHIRQPVVLQPHNLPQPATPFFGRQREMAQVIERINNPNCHLLTLLGSGGVGKTRLALEAAHLILHTAKPEGSFSQGIYFIQLAPVHTVEFIAPTIANALKFSFFGQEPPETQLINYLRHKKMLLILDNFEQLLNGINLLLGILQNAPGIKMILTSRERLNIRAEWLLPIEGLPYLAAREGDEGNGCPPAIELFKQNAEQVRPDFSLTTEEASVFEICRLLEGLPLGIELAAASTYAFSCQQIAAEIKRNLDFLATPMRDVPARHRSLRAIFEHSWALLSDLEQQVFQQLSVFRGGFTVAGAKEVTGASRAILTRLAYKSLLRLDASGRYYLHQLLRQYAAEKLEQIPELKETTYNRHSRYYSAFLQQQEKALKGEKQEQALVEINTEIDNVRRAWRWALIQLEQGQNLTTALTVIHQAAEGLCLFYVGRDWYQEGEEAFGSAARLIKLANITAREKDFLAGKLLAYQGRCCEFTAHPDKAKELFEQSLSIFNRLDNWPEKALPLYGLGYMAHIKGEYEQAEQCLGESLNIYKKIEEPWGVANVLNRLSLVARRQGKFLIARQRSQDSLAIRRQIKDWRGIAASLNNLGLVLCDLGEYAEAEEVLAEGLDICRQFDFDHKVGIGNALTGLCQAAFRLGEIEAAAQFGQQSLTVYQDIGDYWGVAIAYNNLGRMAIELGNYAEAKTLYNEGITIYRQIGVKSGLANTLGNLGEACFKLGEYPEARQHLYEALKMAQELGAIPVILDVLSTLAAILWQEDNASQCLNLLAFVKHHPANLQAVKEKAVALFSEVATTLPPQDVAKAEAQAKIQNVDELVIQILDEQTIW
jgi:predicted ATPase/tetratricopeptide (TPR) repeat protein